MNDLIFTANGINGTVELYSNRLVIKKKFFGLIRKFVSGNKEIYLDSVKDINYKSANSLTNGFIQFETNLNSFELKKGTLLLPPTDDFTVIFSKGQEVVFLDLKKQINDIRNSTKSQTLIQTPLSGAEEIEKYLQLKERGIITQEEFDKKKKQILNYE